MQISIDLKYSSSTLADTRKFQLIFLEVLSYYQITLKQQFYTLLFYFKHFIRFVCIFLENANNRSTYVNARF